MSSLNYCSLFGQTVLRDIGHIPFLQANGLSHDQLEKRRLNLTRPHNKSVENLC